MDSYECTKKVIKQGQESLVYYNCVCFNHKDIDFINLLQHSSRNYVRVRQNNQRNNGVIYPIDIDCNGTTEMGCVSMNKCMRDACIVNEEDMISLESFDITCENIHIKKLELEMKFLVNVAVEIHASRLTEFVIDKLCGERWIFCKDQQIIFPDFMNKPMLITVKDVISDPNLEFHYGIVNGDTDFIWSVAHENRRVTLNLNE